MKLKNWEEKIKRKELRYKTNRYTHDFQHFETARSFADNSYTGKITTDEAEMDQSNLLENIVKFNNKSRPRLKEDKKKKVLLKVHMLSMMVEN